MGCYNLLQLSHTCTHTCILAMLSKMWDFDIRFLKFEASVAIFADYVAGVQFRIMHNVDAFLLSFYL